ncbi:MAG: OmpA family protein [Proteobacteria bacterium]|nr:OmpA family protein [Pseudomonadota bacterium]
MKTKIVSILSLVVVLGFILSGCCALEQAAKDETPPPSPRVEEKVVAEKVIIPASEPTVAPTVAPKVVEKVILLEDIHFDLDKSTLTKEAQMILKRNIQVLKENPNMRIIIQGHTSAIATEEYNQKLSERRAKSVEDFLIKEGGLAPNRLSEIGYGETRLETPEPNPEITESAAAKTNRRVIFKIIVK